MDTRGPRACRLAELMTASAPPGRNSFYGIGSKLIHTKRYSYAYHTTVDLLFAERRLRFVFVVGQLYHVRGADEGHATAGRQRGEVQRAQQ